MGVELGLDLAAFRLFRWHRLDFSMQHQQQTNWCWAAVSTSVALFFNPSSGWTQCAVANGELNRNDCCGAGASGPCNVYGYLDTALTRVGHLDHKATGTSDVFSNSDRDQWRPAAGRADGRVRGWRAFPRHYRLSPQEQH